MVRIRLQRVGRKGLACFRIVAADAKFSRDGKALEILGHLNKDNFYLNEERLNWWLLRGAKITPKLKGRIEYYKRSRSS
jgi:small subunit ribosomal protein S16